MHAPTTRSLRLSSLADALGGNRRRSQRHPVGFYVEQIIDDAAHRCFTSNLSLVGLYMERLAEPLERSTAVVQIEIPLPNTSDALWAKAEVVYDRFDSLFHGTAVRFTAMARQHERWLREWLRDSEHRERFNNLNRARPRVRVVRPVVQSA
jgi:hypothetical protein